MHKAFKGALAVAAILGCGICGHAATAYRARSFHVGAGANSPTTIRAATTPAASFNVSRLTTTIGPDSSTRITLSYVSASGTGLTRTLLVDANCTSVLDGAGNIIANPAPTALCTAITSFASQLDTMIGTAAGANKLNL